MKDLSNFVKTEFVKKQIFENYTFIDTIESVDEVINTLNCGIYMNLKFKTSGLKDYFIDRITTARPEANFINCNCSIERYYDNEFRDLLIFTNVSKCKYEEIINDINKYSKSIKIC
jgi:hypothetical protein